MSPLRPIVPDQIWHSQQPLKFGPLSITTRCTVIRLSDNSLWVHSPVEPTPDLLTALQSIGSVRYVVAPNLSHHLYFLPFLQTIPGTQGFIAPGLADKNPALAGFPVIGQTPESDWSPDLVAWFIEGLPILNETVWLHSPSGTLILTDLLFCFNPSNPLPGKIVSRLLGVYNHLGMSRTMKFMVRDKAALLRSVDQILMHDFQRIVLTHDQIIDQDARARFAAAFEWLRR